mgnify:FL=1
MCRLWSQSLCSADEIGEWGNEDIQCVLVAWDIHVPFKRGMCDVDDDILYDNISTSTGEVTSYLT